LRAGSPTGKAPIIYLALEKFAVGLLQRQKLEIAAIMERKVRDAIVVVFSLYSLNERGESYNDIAQPEVLSLSQRYNSNMIDKERDKEEKWFAQIKLDELRTCNSISKREKSLRMRRAFVSFRIYQA